MLPRLFFFLAGWCCGLFRLKQSWLNSLFTTIRILCGGDCVCLVGTWALFTSLLEFIHRCILDQSSVLLISIPFSVPPRWKMASEYLAAIWSEIEGGRPGKSQSWRNPISPLSTSLLSLREKGESPIATNDVCACMKGTCFHSLTGCLCPRVRIISQSMKVQCHGWVVLL